MVLLSACGGPTRPVPPVNATAGAYLSPPTLVDAQRAPGGDVRLTGQAPAGAVVRLRSPEGGAVTAVAGADGGWMLTVAPAAEPSPPRLYAFQAETKDQVLRGEGALAVLPGPGPVAMVLRPGFASVPTGHGQDGRIQLVTFDYDGEAAAASGLAPPQSTVRLLVDGVTIGISRADALGRFGILGVAAQKIPPGAHVVRMDTPQGLAVERPVTVAAPSLPNGQLFAAAPTSDGWSITWSLTGGGAQTSLIFDDAVAQPPPKAPGPKVAGPKVAGPKVAGR